MQAPQITRPQHAGRRSSGTGTGFSEEEGEETEDDGGKSGSRGPVVSSLAHVQQDSIVKLACGRADVRARLCYNYKFEIARK